MDAVIQYRTSLEKTSIVAVSSLGECFGKNSPILICNLSRLIILYFIPALQNDYLTRLGFLATVLCNSGEIFFLKEQLGNSLLTYASRISKRH